MRLTISRAPPQGPSSQCSSQTRTRGVTAEGRRRILASHNQLRRRVAKGEERGQPGAANMRRMVTRHTL